MFFKILIIIKIFFFKTYNNWFRWLKFTVDFPRCVVLNSSLDIALTFFTANCVQVVIVRAQTIYEQRTIPKNHTKYYYKLKISTYANFCFTLFRKIYRLSWKKPKIVVLIYRAARHLTVFGESAFATGSTLISYK